MSENDCTASPRIDNPAQPYPDFPLVPHIAGVWAKKIRGKLHYFGPWDDPDGALQKYLELNDDLHAGRTHRANSQALTAFGAPFAPCSSRPSCQNRGSLVGVRSAMFSRPLPHREGGGRHRTGPRKHGTQWR